MATAALRGLLVVAALALGFFVLSKAFPSGSDTTAQPGGGVVNTTPPTTSPSVVDSPTRDVPQPLPAEDVRVQVQNGTEVSGLAGDTAEILEQAGYDIVTVNDAEAPYEQTTIFHVPKRKVDAQVIQGQFFPTAVLEVADADVKVDITVIIGSDYVDAQESGGGGGDSTEESPA